MGENDEEQADIDYGLITACDECQMPGSNSLGYPDWQLQPDGRVLCKFCAESLNPPARARKAYLLKSKRSNVNVLS